MKTLFLLSACGLFAGCSAEVGFSGGEAGGGNGGSTSTGGAMNGGANPGGNGGAVSSGNPTAGGGGALPECQEETTEPCYTGPAETQGKGECKDGVRVCANGVWGECEDEVLPSKEACDGLDNDCDDTIDYAPKIAQMTTVPDAKSPAIAHLNGELGAIWTLSVATKPDRVFFASADADGALTVPETLVSSDDPASLSRASAMATDGTDFAAVFLDATDEVDKTKRHTGFAMIDSAGGVSKSSTYLVTGGSAESPDIAASPNGFGVVWSDISGGAAVLYFGLWSANTLDVSVLLDTGSVAFGSSKVIWTSTDFVTAYTVSSAPPEIQFRHIGGDGTPGSGGTVAANAKNPSMIILGGTPSVLSQFGSTSQGVRLTRLDANWANPAHTTIEEATTITSAHLSANEDDGEYGVTLTATSGGNKIVRFIRLSADAQQVGASVDLWSETSGLGTARAHWNGSSWNVVFSAEDPADAGKEQLYWGDICLTGLPS